MTCVTKKHGEIATLHIDTASTGGFTELRAYTEVVVFIIVDEETDAPTSLTSKMKTRTFDVLNHFIDIYRLVTQDPYVYRINEEFDTYLVDFAFGPIPPKLENYSSAEILRNVGEVTFPTVIGKGRLLKYRLNTLEDLFPGPILEEPFLKVFQKLVEAPYQIPLHYELILTAQVELKRRNYHVAILEAETAFELYVASTLVGLSTALGFAKNQVIAELENPKKLGLLSKRLNRLDTLVNQFRIKKGVVTLPNFVNGAAYDSWKKDLYELRNKIIHGGWRQATFELAKQAIKSCKIAMKEFEDRIEDLADTIQISSDVNQLVNTAGRLKY